MSRLNRKQREPSRVNLKDADKGHLFSSDEHCLYSIDVPKGGFIAEEMTERHRRELLSKFFCIILSENFLADIRFKAFIGVFGS